jgi:predicted lysophospholipase L1 biosynthesis ABC-type transport system permease subunit
MMKIEPARNPLRRARLSAGLQIRDLEVLTRISPAMLRHIDEGDFHKLPAGIYAQVLRDLEEVLPRAVDPLEPKGPDTSAPPTAPRIAAAASPLRMLDRWRRSAAAALDGIILSSISIAVWIATATAARVDPAALGLSGGLSIGAITAAVAAAYFVLFAGIAGRTPGAMLLACPVDDERERLDLNEIGRRAGQTALQESSIVVDLMLPADLPPTVEGRSVRA